MPDGSSDIMNEAAALLVARGYTREWAEELLRRQGLSGHPENARDWVDQILGSEQKDAKREQVLEEHHRHGIPPYEPPARD